MLLKHSLTQRLLFAAALLPYSQLAAIHPRIKQAARDFESQHAAASTASPNPQPQQNPSEFASNLVTPPKETTKPKRTLGPRTRAQ